MVFFRAALRSAALARASAPATASTRPAVRLGGAGTVTLTAAASFFTWGAGNQGDSKASKNSNGGSAGWISKSGYLVREGSAAMAAIRVQPYTLVFVSSPNVDANVDATSRRRWGAVLGYFQEAAGYDCLDLTAKAERVDGAAGAKDEHEELVVLAEELHAQLRLAMLQRPPVVFTSPPSSRILSAYIGPDSRSTPLLSAIVVTLAPPSASGFTTSTTAATSAADALAASALPSSAGTTAGFRAPVLVVVPAYPDADHDAASLERRARELWGPKAELLRVPSKDPHSAESVREIERWLIAHGF